MTIASFVACTHYALKQSIPLYEGLIRAYSSPAPGIISYVVGNLTFKKKVENISSGIFISTYSLEGDDFLLDFSVANLNLEFGKGSVADVIRRTSRHHQNLFIFSTEGCESSREIFELLGIEVKKFTWHIERRPRPFFGFMHPQCAAYTFIGDEDELLHSALYVNMLSKIQVYKMSALESMEAA